MPDRAALNYVFRLSDNSYSFRISFFGIFFSSFTNVFQTVMDFGMCFDHDASTVTDTSNVDIVEQLRLF